MGASIENNFYEIRKQIESVSQNKKVKIVGVTKTVPTEKIVEASRAGLVVFGENRMQEAIPKIKDLSALSLEWHFIGHLQTNKAHLVVESFSCIQSVDSIKLLMQIEKEAERLEKNIDLLLEVNLGEEESKYGFKRDALSQALPIGKTLKRSRIRGLMIIPPFFEDPEKVRPYFRELKEIRDLLAVEFPSLTELSMGMSHDYLIAVQEGATMVRIGTAIFGSRP